MSESIKVGDLVMVVRPLWCGHGKKLGVVGAVIQILPNHDNGEKCDTCHALLGPSTVVSLAGHERPFDLYRLKRIDPDANAISEDARKTIKEPA